MTRKIFKTGHSLAVTLSKKVLEDLGLKEGDGVEVSSENQKIVIKPAGHKEQLSLGLKIKPKLR
jgi:antitoxin component of MazEF toxin-antitoxin module